MDWSLMVMRMLVKVLSESTQLERPAVGFGLSLEPVYDGRPLLDAWRCQRAGNDFSPSSGVNE
jgi:hypothetical protein